MGNSILGSNLLGGSDVPDTTPMVPGAGTPLPTGLTSGADIASAPEKDEDQGPGTSIGPDWVDQLAGAFVHTTATAASRPGSFASKLNGALSRIGADLGIPAMQARQEQMQKQKQQDFQNKLATNRDAREEKDSQMRSALNAMQISVEAQRLKNEKADFAEKGYAAGRAFAADLEKKQAGEELTENEIKQRTDEWDKDPANSGKTHWAQEHVIVPVNHVDVNGQKTTVYKVYQKDHEMAPISETERNYINKYYGNAQEIPEGTQLKTEDVQAMHAKAMTVEQNIAKLEDLTGHKLMPEQTRQMAQDLSTPIVSQAMSVDPADRIRGFQSTVAQNDAFITQMQHLQQLLANHADPKMIQALQQKMQNSKDPQEQQEAKELLGIMGGLQKRDPQAIKAAQKEVQDHLDAAQKDQKSLQNVSTFAFTKEDRELFEKHENELRQERRDAMKAANDARKASQDKALEKKQSQGQTVVTKVDDTYTKSAKGLEGAYADILRAQDNDQLANSMGSLFVALGVAESNDIRRINRNEIEQAGPEVGSWMRKAQGWFEKAKDGKLPADTLQEMQTMIKSLQDISYRTYVDQQLRNQHNYQLDDDVEISGQNGRGSISLGDARKKYGNASTANTANTSQGSNQFAGKFGVAAGGKTHYFNTKAEADAFQAKVDAATGVNRKAVGNFISSTK